MTAKREPVRPAPAASTVTPINWERLTEAQFREQENKLRARLRGIDNE